MKLYNEKIVKLEAEQLSLIENNLSDVRKRLQINSIIAFRNRREKLT